jgi:adenylate kinase family enzyme
METERHELTADTEALQEQFRHVYWIGGGSSAGKSTIARRIAAEHDLQRYATDDVMEDHSRRSTPERALRNLLDRDAMFTHRLYEEAKLLELNTIEVDPTMTVDDLARLVREPFGL